MSILDHFDFSHDDEEEERFITKPSLDGSKAYRPQYIINSNKITAADIQLAEHNGDKRWRAEKSKCPEATEDYVNCDGDIVSKDITIRYQPDDLKPMFSLNQKENFIPYAENIKEKVFIKTLDESMGNEYFTPVSRVILESCEKEVNPDFWHISSNYFNYCGYDSGDEKIYLSNNRFSVEVIEKIADFVNYFSFHPPIEIPDILLLRTISRNGKFQGCDKDEETIFPGFENVTKEMCPIFADFSSIYYSNRHLFFELFCASVYFGIEYLQEYFYRFLTEKLFSCFEEEVSELKQQMSEHEKVENVYFSFKRYHNCKEIMPKFIEDLMDMLYEFYKINNYDTRLPRIKLFDFEEPDLGYNEKGEKIKRNLDDYQLEANSTGIPYLMENPHLIKLHPRKSKNGQPLEEYLQKYQQELDNLTRSAIHEYINNPSFMNKFRKLTDDYLEESMQEDQKEREIRERRSKARNYVRKQNS